MSSTTTTTAAAAAATKTVDVVVDTVVGDAILPIHEKRQVAVDAAPKKRES